MDFFLKKYFWVVNLVVIATCAALAGRAGAHLIEQNWLLGDDPSAAGPLGAVRRAFVPPPPNGDHGHAKEIERITTRNVFCSTCAPLVDKIVKPDDGPRAPVKTSLPFELVSTMWVEANPVWSMAVIRSTASKEKDALMYNAGKALDGSSATVMRVDPRKVYLKNGSGIEYLELEGGEKKKEEVPAAVAVAPGAGGDPIDNDVQKGVRCNGANCEVDRPLIDKLLANTAGLATAARFVPSVKDGRPNGFKLYAIRPSSIFGKIGLQNGDTIKSINGMEMASPDQALGVYSKLRSASHLTVSVERRGESVTLDYSIK